MPTPTLADDDEEADTDGSEPEPTEEPEDTAEEAEETADSPVGLFDGVEEGETTAEEETGDTADSEPPEDPDEQLVQLDEETASMFDDVEDSSDGPRDDPEDTAEDDEPANPFGEEDELDAGVGGIVVETASEGFCLGLDEEQTAELQPQYESLFKTMRLGYFSQRVFEEKIMAGNDTEIDPVWGLVASAVICSCVAFWMRPDRDEHIETIKDIFNGENE